MGLLTMKLSTTPWGPDLFLHTSEEAGDKTWAYWQNRINRASLVMLSEEKILTDEQAHTIAHAQKRAEEIQENGDCPPIFDIMPLEKLLINECGQEATLIHTGRSRQDIFATLNQARLRLSVLDLYESLNNLRSRLLLIAEDNIKTWMPVYTNGVQAMPVSLGFYLWGFLESFERDSDRIQEAWRRINLTALGTAVLACSAWPLSRKRLAELLGFDGSIVNGLDSSQISLFDIPLEAAGIASNIAIRITTLIQDLAQQYSQVKPWLLLDQGSVYSSSAMPQKRNPGILNKTRAIAGDVIGAAHTSVIRAHNLNLGMYDNKESVSEDNSRVFVKAVEMLELTALAFSLLRVDKERALEELNNDWTCTMALAERLQMETGLPFRVGHNFASRIVTEARKSGWMPKTFPYDEAQRIFTQICEELIDEKEELPLDEVEFRRTLSPEYVIESRTGVGNPSSESVAAGLATVRERLEKDVSWLKEAREKISQADKNLDELFEALLKQEE